MNFNNNCKINLNKDLNLNNNNINYNNINNNNDSFINFESFNPKLFNKSNITIKHCRYYLNNVKKRFINDPILYQTFEIILKEYYSDPINIHYQDVYNDIALLFNDNHQDLLNQLAYFLPFEQN